MQRTTLYWTCQVGGWSAYVLSRLGPQLILYSISWQQAVGQIAVGGIGILLTDAFRRFVQRMRWKEMDLWALAPRVVVASIVLSVASHFLLDRVYVDGLGVSLYESTTRIRLFVESVGQGTFVYLAWSLAYFGVNYFESYREAEVQSWKMKAQAEAARLEALKLQLNPHFLFNSLNSVRALIHPRPDRAETVVTQLSRLLQRTLRSRDTLTVPLHREIDTARAYLDLESVRFEDRLSVDIDVPESFQDYHVPLLLVQTLAENAVKHGIAQVPGGGTVAIRVRETEPTHGGTPRLRMCVNSPGHLGTLDASTAGDSGIGLDNLRERLALLFGDDATLTLRNLDEDRVRAEVILPALHEAPSDPGPLSADAESVASALERSALHPDA